MSSIAPVIERTWYAVPPGGAEGPVIFSIGMHRQEPTAPSKRQASNVLVQAHL